MTILLQLLTLIPPPRSVHHQDAAVGFNGGFEHLADGGPEQQYPINWIVRFAVRNQGARWRVRAGMVGARSGDMRVRMESDADTPDWSHHEIRVERPWYRRTLRFEFNVVGPGTVELDDVSVRPADQR